jgi:cytochrome c-type biogenesis protein CcmH
LIVILAFVVCLALAGGVYLALGDSAEPASESTPAPHSLTPQDTEEMAAGLAERLAKNPADPEGWDSLARTYASLGQFAEAAEAYENLERLMPEDPQVLADWADVLAMAQGRNFDGKPEALVRRALAADPDYPKALALAGNIAFARQDYAAALGHWDRMLAKLPADSSLARALAADIAEARKLATTPARN